MIPDPNKSPVAPISRKRAMALQALGGYINTGIQVAQGLLLIPLYLHFIEPHLYGLWLASGGILAMLGVMNLGLGSLLVQRVAKAYGQSDLPKAGEYFINGLAVYLMLASAFVGIGLLLSYHLTGLLQVTKADDVLLRQCFQIAVVATGLGLINECLRGFAFALLRPLYSTLALAGSRIVGAITTVLLLYHWELGLWAIPVGMLVVECVVLLLNVLQSVSLFHYLGASWVLNRVQINEYFQTGGLLFASRLGQALSRETDPLLITLFLRPELTVFYMVTRKAADTIFQLLSVINASMNGSFSHLAGSEDAAKIRIVAAKLLSLVFFVGLVGFSSYALLNEGFVKLWVGETFILDHNIIFFIGLAYFINILRNMTLQMLNGLGEFNYTSSLVLLEGLIKTGLAILLLTWIGLIGIPIAHVATSALMLIVMGMKLNKHISLPITLQTYGKAIAASIILFGLAGIIPQYMVVDSWLQFTLHATDYILITALIIILLNGSAINALLKTT